MDPDIFPEGHSFKGCNESDFLGTNFKNKIAIVAHGDCLVGLEWRDSYWNQGSTDQAIRSGQDCVTPIIGALWYSFGQKNVIQLIYISRKSQKAELAIAAGAKGLVVVNSYIHRLVKIVLDESVAALKSIPIIMVFQGEMENYMTSKSIKVKYSVSK